MTTQKKLTLRIDRELVRRAKSYAEKSGKSVSAMVADYFEHLDARGGRKRPRLTAGVRSLMGILPKTVGDKEDYRKHLERKHR